MKNHVCFCLMLIVSCLICNAYAGATREQMEKMGNSFRNTCVTKTGVDRSLAEGVRDGKFSEDQLVKCYIKCIMGLMKTFTKQNTIDIDMLIKQINIMASPDIVDSMKASAQKCFAETSSDEPCDLAYKFTHCVYNSDPAIFFFP